MDPALAKAIAGNAIAILTPAVIKIAKAATGPVKEMGEELIETLGKTAGKQVVSLMKMISSKSKGDPVAENALGEFVQAPQDQDAQAALRLQLRNMLIQDEAFAQDLRRLLESEESDAKEQVRITVEGSRNVVMSEGDVQAPIISGDIKDSDIKISG
jgi:hypothetical protein